MSGTCVEEMTPRLIRDQGFALWARSRDSPLAASQILEQRHPLRAGLTPRCFGSNLRQSVRGEQCAHINRREQKLQRYNGIDCLTQLAMLSCAVKHAVRATRAFSPNRPSDPSIRQIGVLD